MNTKYTVIVIILSVFAFITGIGAALIQNNSVVNASATTSPPPVSSAETISATPRPSTNTINSLETTPVTQTKDMYSIAIVGDSMVDTMGEDLPYLRSELEKTYPEIDFKLYNYGMGAQTIFQAYDRFSDTFSYKTRDYPSLPDLKPDILIVASFAYNPVYPFDRDAHWLKLSEFIDVAKSASEDVYVLAEVAPVGVAFGKGAAETAGWPDSQRIEHSTYVVDLLGNAIGMGSAKDVTVIDIYSETKSIGDFGNGTFTNSGDGIHPSEKGHQLTAEKIVDTLILK